MTRAASIAAVAAVVAVGAVLTVAVLHPTSAPQPQQETVTAATIEQRGGWDHVVVPLTETERKEKAAWKRTYDQSRSATAKTKAASATAPTSPAEAIVSNVVSARTPMKSDRASLSAVGRSRAPLAGKSPIPAEYHDTMFPGVIPKEETWKTSDGSTIAKQTTSVPALRSDVHAQIASVSTAPAAVAAKSATMRRALSTSAQPESVSIDSKHPFSFGKRTVLKCTCEGATCQCVEQPTDTAVAARTPRAATTAASGVQVLNLSRTINIVAAPPSGCPTLTTGRNVFLDYNGAASGCRTGAACKAGEAITFNIAYWAGYNPECAAHTYSWSLDGTAIPGNDTSVVVTLPAVGTHKVACTVSNGSQTFVITQAVTAAGTPPPAYPTWESCATLTFPPDHVTASTASGISVILDAQLKSDTDVSLKWAQDANAKCNCNGYDWLKCNGAAYRDWFNHGKGEDPVTYFCRQGLDSPLASYNERFGLNRTIDQIGLTVAEVWFNAKRYTAQILPVDCLAGCTVYVDLPCEKPRQATVVTLRDPAHEQYGLCVAYSADGKVRAGMGTCPPREVK